jgi:6-phosphogluconolactonase
MRRLKHDVRVYPDAEAMAGAAALYFVERAADAIAARGRFRVALSGGSTPKGAYAELASKELRTRVQWSSVDVLWGDERCVPPDHPDSNYRMANEALLSSVPIPPANVHRMPEGPSPEQAAERYATVLREVFRLSREGLPRFDLILLGLGEDGHTASLFPGSGAAAESGRIVASSGVKKGGHYRLTLTLPVINNAAAVAFLVSGKRKSAVLRAVLAGGPLPAASVRPHDGALVWFVDEAAAQP